VGRSVSTSPYNNAHRICLCAECPWAVLWLPAPRIPGRLRGGLVMNLSVNKSTPPLSKR